MWIDMNRASSWTLGKTLLAAPAGSATFNGSPVNPQLAAFAFINSYGHGNYNAAFASFTAKDWHGLTARNNFTWGRALGTGSVTQASSSITVPNPYDFNTFGSYGVQPFDVKFTYSLVMLYQEPFFKSQKGVLGRVLGGWTIAPLFVARTGLPQRISSGSGGNTNAQAFGEVYGNNNSGNYEQAAGYSPFTGGNSVNYNVVSTGAGSNGNAAKNGSGINLFADPATVYNQFRRPVLGIDTSGGGNFAIRGFPYWNLDATISKDFRVKERIGATLTFQFVNLLNHFVPADPTTNIDSPNTWGVVTDQYTAPNGAMARQMEFGLRLRF